MPKKQKTPEQERQSIIKRARKLLEEAQLNDNTVEYWNRMHPNEEPIAAGFEAMVRATLGMPPKTDPPVKS